ncbi:unnamed protein product [Kuraishia capsulata CBS 1993]|uniref:Large ribosomal subunit protein mL43 n=1 Tax=Kuraishia capsulata CBS 1993 TaxID=1382522 RepID=W6MIE7_9ASCO|nr:uncharacterized protein KUCA_T00000082001 [Kuraishia capsulata CBS 1993]CDK24122.1 unnamed protein product [Kuraishia capsulata CBS 1993]
MPPYNGAIKAVSVARNGVGAFIRPCRKITLQYCNVGGSSQGLRDFLTQRLTKFATKYPEIEFQVALKRGHPIVRGLYSTTMASNPAILTNDSTKLADVHTNVKTVCLRNLNIDNVENKLKLMVESSGNRLYKPKQAVQSLNQSVRGIWSPFHVDKDHRFKI